MNRDIALGILITIAVINLLWTFRQQLQIDGLTEAYTFDAAAEEWE